MLKIGKGQKIMVFFPQPLLVILNLTISNEQK
jgi:hypothetical protein